MEDKLELIKKLVQAKKEEYSARFGFMPHYIAMNNNDTIEIKKLIFEETNISGDEIFLAFRLFEILNMELSNSRWVLLDKNTMYTNNKLSFNVDEMNC